MIVELVIPIILLLWPMTTTEVAAASLAKPGCQDRCGGIDIPYPFGIGGDNCSADEWFSIDCNSSSRPFLRLINLEVLQISVSDSSVRVRTPVFYWNCGGKKQSGEVVNLERSPFVFSQENRFTAVGCDNLAVMTLNDTNGTNSIVGGCLPICDKSYNSPGTNRCYGKKCCQTQIPVDLNLFYTDFMITKEEKSVGCNYAFLTDQVEFGSTGIGGIKDEGYAPALLNWEFSNSTSIRVITDLESSIYYNTTAGGKITFVGYYYYYRFQCSAPLQNSSTFSGLKCSCSWGYEGNPYLLYGCEDINECYLYNHSICGSSATCVNYPGSYSCYRRSYRVKMIILGIGVGLGLLFLLIGGWWLYKVLKKRKNIKRKEKFFKQNGGLLLQQQLSSGEVNVERTKLFNSNELEKATDRFNVDRILGQGGQGTVYKGMLTDGKIVAVKKSKVVDDKGKLQQFINEVIILSQINHRNVVKLLGCCLETEVPLLVYEFIPNGTLFQYIHEENEEFPLTWNVRLQIAVEIAGAISYLHSAASLPIYHRDIKSTNILLDEKYKAKLADFGTSRSVTIDQTHVTTQVQGTFGYLDPEYFRSSQFTDKSDVYSFGVVLVELLTGQKPISSSGTQEYRSLVACFIQTLEENRLFDILDARILMEGGKEEIIVVAKLAERCLNLNGKKRPTMKEVTRELDGICMSQKSSGVQQNHEEVEYVRTEIHEPWDAVSTSMGSSLDSGVSSSLDVQPLLSI